MQGTQRVHSPRLEGGQESDVTESLGRCKKQPAVAKQREMEMLHCCIWHRCAAQRSLGVRFVRRTCSCRVAASGTLRGYECRAFQLHGEVHLDGRLDSVSMLHATGQTCSRLT